MQSPPGLRRSLSNAGLMDYWECCRHVIETESPGTHLNPNWHRRVAAGMLAAIEYTASRARLKRTKETS